MGKLFAQRPETGPADTTGRPILADSTIVGMSGRVSLASGAISNAYYPESNRGPKLVFSTGLADIGGTMVNALLAEFLMHRPTRAAK